jgi:ABC-type glycerol-3-phosphate transport system permease component
MATIATMPMILVYVGLQRYVIKGIATTGLKL